MDLILEPRRPAWDAGTAPLSRSRDLVAERMAATRREKEALRRRRAVSIGTWTVLLLLTGLAVRLETRPGPHRDPRLTERTGATAGAGDARGEADAR